MKKQRWFVTAMAGLMALILMATGAPALADDHEDEGRQAVTATQNGIAATGDAKVKVDKKKVNRVWKEPGEAFGWGAAGVALAAGLAFPLLRTGALGGREEAGGWRLGMATLVRWFARWHRVLGLLAVGAAGAHGVFMYLAENRLNGEAWLGIAAVSLMALGSLVGWAGAFKKYRLHLMVILLAAIVALIHVAG